MTQASVHVVIVNWNAGRHLAACLDSLARSEQKADLISRVTVVDNASTDGSTDRLDRSTLPLEVVRNPANVGFAAACNQGAAGSTADYLLFLNPDTEVFPDTLATVVRFMESEDAGRVGICGAWVVDGAGRTLIAAGRFPTLRVMVGKVTRAERLLPGLFPPHHLTPTEICESRSVDQVIGAFFLVRRPLFEELGGFDTRYFLYFEEVDFSLRARERGALSYLLRDARVVHAENVSSNQVPEARLFHSLRSRLLFAYSHWPLWHANVMLGLTLTVELVGRLGHAGLRRSAADPTAVARAYRRLIAEAPTLLSETRRARAAAQH
jgi:N-acetylglucosaminyl-diphospho-decaprenol L-rhamnosyltransferase